MKYTFNHLLIAAFIGGLLGILIREWTGKKDIEHLNNCFDSCASLLLLTPDDPDIYKQLLKEVEDCANEPQGNQ